MTQLESMQENTRVDSSHLHETIQFNSGHNTSDLRLEYYHARLESRHSLSADDIIICIKKYFCVGKLGFLKIVP